MPALRSETAREKGEESRAALGRRHKAAAPAAAPRLEDVPGALRGPSARLGEEIPLEPALAAPSFEPAPSHAPRDGIRAGWPLWASPFLRGGPQLQTSQRLGALRLWSHARQSYCHGTKRSIKVFQLLPKGNGPGCIRSLCKSPLPRELAGSGERGPCSAFTQELGQGLR